MFLVLLALDRNEGNCTAAELRRPTAPRKYRDSDAGT